MKKFGSIIALAACASLLAACSDKVGSEKKVTAQSRAAAAESYTEYMIQDDSSVSVRVIAQDPFDAAKSVTLTGALESGNDSIDGKVVQLSGAKGAVKGEGVCHEQGEFGCKVFVASISFVGADDQAKSVAMVFVQDEKATLNRMNLKDKYEGQASRPSDLKSAIQELLTPKSV